MVRVIITENLKRSIGQQFKKQSIDIFNLMLTLEDSPNKGKVVGNIGGILVKELKYQSYRFYFLVDGYKLKFLECDELQDLLIKFVRMSDKDKQQQTINQIKQVLRQLGPEGFAQPV
ncbi:MAG: hypothetical protein ACOCWQ_04735 [Nanoarchaeota archaeon]